MPLSTTAVQRPVTTTMFSAGIVMLGVITLLNLSIDFLPAIDVPTLTIQTAYPDTSPEEVEDAITDPIESTLGTIAEVKRIRSISREGMSIVTVAFYWGTNMDFAVLGVREKLDKARGTFPREAGRPTILRVDPSADPVMTVAISSPRLRADSSSGGLAELKETARALVKRRIEQVECVAQASVLGGIEREILVDVDMAMLNALGLDCGQLGDALGAANVDLPGGTVKQGHFRYSLKTLGSLTSIEDIRNVIVRSAGSGRPVRVADCATVREAFAERSGLTRFNGQEVIVVQVRKEAGANTVAVSRNVRIVLSQLQQENPDLGLSVIADQAEFVRKSIADVEQAILTGGVLAFLVLFAFLRQPRYPLIIGLTMPVSVLATIVAMYFLRINLNIISLTGLALGIGMLGDNAIVLVENVSRLREQGVPIRGAALQGAREIGTAVTASTLTNVAVFLPIVFVEGVAAQLFVDMGVTMTISLLVSLLVAVTLVPMLVSREARGVGAASGPWSGTSPAMRASPAGWSTRADMLVRRSAEVYIVWALEHRPTVVLGSLGLFLVAVLVAFFIPAEPAPDIDQNRFLVQLRMPRGTSLEGVSRFSRLLESELRSLRGVSGVYARIGMTEEQAAWNADDAASESADLDVQIERAGLTPSLMDSARALLKRFALVTSGIEYAVKPRGTSFEQILRPEANDIRCMILGKDPVTAARCAAAYANAIRPVRGLVDLRTSLQDGTPEYHIMIDREAAGRHGLNVRSVAAHVTQMVRGNEATSLNDFGRKIAVRVQPPERSRNDLDAILDSFIPAGENGVPLRTLVTWKETKGYAQIWRENQQRTHLLVANVSGRPVGNVVRDLEEVASRLHLPPGYEIRIGGENQEIRESFEDLILVIILSLLLVFMILAAEYESILYPLVIILTSPLAAIGAILAMAATGQHFNVMSLVGVVIMIGAVDNDAVIVVDLITDLRRKGNGVRDAIVQGMQQRLRPILMTTATTVLGIIPLAFEFGEGSELVRALTVPLIGGLFSSTLFTVLTIPVVYAYVDRWGSRPIVPPVSACEMT